MAPHLRRRWRGRIGPAERPHLTRDLLSLLQGRFVFVVGKGGVGKSTAASAIALALAADSGPTHLLSTDPAHSLADLFGQPLEPGATVESRCDPRLTLEELDARARVSAWTAALADPVGELVDLGTYLERNDIRTLLDLALPGSDELMGALRLEELAEEGSGRVVVDTAPTGHTLRLLEAGRVLASWADALEAMAAKAGAVQERLLRRSVRLAGEEVMEELRGRTERFESKVLGTADFVVVSRYEEVVLAETARLVRRLESSALRVAAELRVGGTAPPRRSGGRSLFHVPWGGDLVGCDGLRRWGRAQAPPRASTEPGRGGAVRPLSPHFLERELLFVVGKGGVGKSTCAAACALELSRRREVLLLDADPAGSLEDLLPAADGLPDGRRLRIRRVDAEREFEAFQTRSRDEVAELFERLGLGGSARLDRRVLDSLLSLAPAGLDEIFALHAVLEERGEAELLVVDAAPTGHFLRLVEMPEVALAWTRGVLRILLRYREALGLGASAEQLLHFARRLRSLLALLRDSHRTAALVVTLDAPVVRSETDRLLSSLRGSGLAVLAVLRNRAAENAPPSPYSGVDEITAPVRPRPPKGAEALQDFFSRWELSR